MKCCLLLLSGCGVLLIPDDWETRKGTSDTASPTDTGEEVDSGLDDNRPPLADAGRDRVAEVDEIIELDGSGSFDPDGDALTCQWDLTDKPVESVSVLLNADRCDASFLIDAEGEYVFSLVVSDGRANSLPDRMTVIASSRYDPPVADAGDDQVVRPGDTVYLDGSGSWDPYGQSLDYTWTFSSLPGGSVAALFLATTASAMFVTDVEGVYVVQLVVSDGRTESNPDLATIVAVPAK